MTESCCFCFRQNQEREILQKRHKEEIEDFMKTRGISISHSPINLTMPTASVSLNNASMLSPLSMNTIPNPPPLPATMMSLSVANNFPIFSMPRHQPGIVKGANTFAEELHRYVEARNQAVMSQTGGLDQLDVNAIDSETSSSQDLDALGTLGSESDLNSVELELEHDQLLEDAETRARLASAETGDVQPLTPQQQMVSPMQETMVPNQAFIMQPPMYNLYSSPTMGQYLSPVAPSHLQMVEAGLLPHYPLMSVANSVAVTTTTSTTSSPSPSLTEEYQTDS